MVFVHGIPTSPDLWRYVLPRLPDARCLAFEMVGYGTSMQVGRGRDISVASQARYLLWWLRQMDIDRAIFVGHDLGGGVVQNLAMLDRDMVAGLLLTNSIGYRSWPIPSVKVLRAMGGLIRHLPALLVKAMLLPLFVRGHDDPEIARESFQIHWEKYADSGAGEALIRQVRSLDVRDTARIADGMPLLAGIPTRLVWGAADPFQPMSVGEQFARDLDAPLERIEGGRHFTPEDHPGSIARGVRTLLDTIGKPRRVIHQPFQYPEQPPAGP